MSRAATPTLSRTLLVCALAAWVALATTQGFAPSAVWAGVAAGLGLLAVLEVLARRASRRASPQGPMPSSSPPQRSELRAPPPELAAGDVPNGLLQPFGPLPPPTSLLPAVSSRIELPSSDSGKSFARLVPFGDAREVIVRRGDAMGHRYGQEQGRRLVTIAGHRFLVVRYLTLLSPPALRPGDAPMSAEAARSYKPESDVLYLPDAEVLMRREPRGFSDAEVERILAAIVLVPLSPSSTPSDQNANELLDRALACLRVRSSLSYELKDAIQVTASAGSASVIPLLRSYLRDTDLTVVEAACVALTRLNAREASSDLIDLLRPEAASERNIDCSGDPFGWPEPPPRASALIALTAMRIAEAEPAVRRLLADVDGEVQRLAHHYLRELDLTAHQR